MPGEGHLVPDRPSAARQIAAGYNKVRQDNGTVHQIASDCNRLTTGYSSFTTVWKKSNIWATGKHSLRCDIAFSDVCFSCTCMLAMMLC